MGWNLWLLRLSRISAHEKHHPVDAGSMIIPSGGGILRQRERGSTPLTAVGTLPKLRRTMTWKRNSPLRALAAAGLLLLPASMAAAQELDYEALWDRLADAGNFAPHQPVLQALLEHRTIVFAHDVNANAAQHLMASLVLLDKRAPGEPIHLYVRSNGGWSADIFAIIDVIESLESPVHTYAAGVASSAGAMLVAAGTGTRTALPHAMISIHDNIVGPEEDDEEFSDQRIERAVELAFWKRVAKLPDDWFVGGRDVFFHLDAEQALEFGVIDVIAPPFERRRAAD